MKKVAVTGSMSCGKSSVCRFLKECGAYVVSADKIVHQLLSIDTKLIQKVVRLLGPDIAVSGQLDRAKIAKKVFTNKKLLQELENLLHPAVSEEIQRQYQEVKKAASSLLFVAEIPLLFETGGETNYDATVVVASDLKKCRSRFKQATGYPDEEYDRRMSRQWSIEKKIKKATFVIVNDSNLDDLRELVKNLYNRLLEV